MTHPQITVVVADDNARYKTGVERALRRRDGVVAVTGVSDGLAALQAIKRDRPDVALLDQQMRGLTGLEVLRAVRGDPDLAAVSVLLMSAESSRSTEQRAREAGARAWVDKNQSRAEICAIVERAARSGPAVGGDPISPECRATS